MLVLDFFILMHSAVLYYYYYYYYYYLSLVFCILTAAFCRSTLQRYVRRCPGCFLACAMNFERMEMEMELHLFLVGRIDTAMGCGVSKVKRSNDNTTPK
jgi:hypothetical protein